MTLCHESTIKQVYTPNSPACAEARLAAEYSASRHARQVTLYQSYMVLLYRTDALPQALLEIKYAAAIASSISEDEKKGLFDVDPTLVEKL